MNRLWQVLLFISLAAAAAYSQSPSPVPKPTAPGDDDVVKISTNLIQIDVTVTDAKGKIVTDLKPDEIEIYENGEKQSLTSLNFVENYRAKNPKATESNKTNNVILPTSPIRPENVKRTVALVVDDLTISFADMWSTKDALRRFVREQMQEGDLVALICTGGGIGAASQFTNDRRSLLSAIDKLQFNMVASSRIGSFDPIRASLLETMDGTRNIKNETRNLGKDIQSEREFENDLYEFRETIFSTGTLGAINYVIRGMRDLPGRKSIVFISGGLSLNYRDKDGRPGFSRLLDSLQRLTDFANRAAVVIYAIDARGVTVNELSAEDDPSGLNDTRLENRLRDRRDQSLDSQTGLRYLAFQTGGTIYVQNNINNGIARALEDQRYYLASYEPNQSTFDPKKSRFNKIDIKVLRPGTKVRFRSGFFGITDEKIAESKAADKQAVYSALTSPFGANDVALRLNSLFIPDTKKNLFLRNFLHIDAANLSFERQTNGTYITKFDLIAAAFNENGISIDGERRTCTVAISEESYKRVRETGIVYESTLKLRKPGGYQMRVAVKDNATNKVGSANQFVDIPDLKKNRLALSGILLENVGIEDWNKLESSSPEEASKLVDPVGDTAARQFRPGSVLTYTSFIINPKSDSQRKISTTTQAKLFNDRELVWEGNPFQQSFSLDETADKIVASGSLELKRKFPLGQYVLQVIVTDKNSSGKSNTAFQFVRFEIVR